MTKHTQVETFFGDREILFVRYPTSMTVADIVEKLFWAKAWIVEEMYSSLIVRAVVKPHYLKHFLKSHGGELLPFEVILAEPAHFRVKTDKSTYSIFMME